MSTPYEAKEWKNDINAFKAEYGLEGGSVNTPYEIKPWMNEIEALRAEIEEGGGGGSSDFSTAQVTLINHSESYDKVLSNVAIIDDNYLATSVSFPEPEYDSVWSVVLYKGHAYATINSQGVQVNVSGNVRLSSTGVTSTTLDITGDGTIEITARI